MLLGGWKSRKSKGKLDEEVRAVYLTQPIGITLGVHSSVKGSQDDKT